MRTGNSLRNWKNGPRNWKNGRTQKEEGGIWNWKNPLRTGSVLRRSRQETGSGLEDVETRRRERLDEAELKEASLPKAEGNLRWLDLNLISAQRCAMDLDRLIPLITARRYFLP